MANRHAKSDALQTLATSAHLAQLPIAESPVLVSPQEYTGKEEHRLKSGLSWSPDHRATDSEITVSKNSGAPFLMLQSLQQRLGEKLRASDGEVGHVLDFYFDDKNWNVRYLVADTGHWLPGRLVLVSPHAFGHLYPEGKVLLVNLTRQQIEDSPSIDQHKPVSRQHEEEYYQHYGYNYYAEDMPLWGLAGYPVMIPPPPATTSKQSAGDAHLRSAKELTGYSVEANDGTVGEIFDFLVDGRTWMIREVVVECGHWYAGNKIIVPTEKIGRINYELRTVHVDSKKQAFTTASTRDHQTHAA